MNRLRVGVIRGGISDEYPVSIKTGASVLKNIPEDKYKTIDILIDRNGVWHSNGVVQKPEDIFSHIDVIFNALHGYYGEDGKIQKILDTFGVQYTGSGMLGSALAMNKKLSKEIFLSNGIKTPYYEIINKDNDVDSMVLALYRRFPQPSIIKPLSGGSSLGVSIPNNFEEFVSSIKNAFKHSHSVLIEEYKDGIEVTCGVIDNFRDNEYYALPPIEIVTPKSSKFFDYEAKYSGVSEELCPSPSLSNEAKKEVMRLAIIAHRSLGLKHYSRSDFMVTKNGIYILETNTLPGLTEESLLPKSLDAVGCSFSNFLDHLITLALNKK